jgi:hypothetical protein
MDLKPAHRRFFYVKSRKEPDPLDLDLDSSARSR